MHCSSICMNQTTAQANHSDDVISRHQSKRDSRCRCVFLFPANFVFDKVTSSLLPDIWHNISIDKPLEQRSASALQAHHAKCLSYGWNWGRKGWSICACGELLWHTWMCWDAVYMLTFPTIMSFIISTPCRNSEETGMPPLSSQHSMHLLFFPRLLRWSLVSGWKMRAPRLRKNIWLCCRRAEWWRSHRLGLMYCATLKTETSTSAWLNDNWLCTTARVHDFMTVSLFTVHCIPHSLRMTWHDCWRLHPLLATIVATYPLTGRVSTTWETA